MGRRDELLVERKSDNNFFNVLNYIRPLICFPLILPSTVVHSRFYTFSMSRMSREFYNIKRLFPLSIYFKCLAGVRTSKISAAFSAHRGTGSRSGL